MRSIPLTSDRNLSVIGLGAWPLAGMAGDRKISSDEADQIVRQALACGITHFDTAFCYGLNGESEQCLARTVPRQPEFTIATKGGVVWQNGKQVRTGNPAAIREQCELSLQRLNRDCLDLYYLHAPDPAVPIAESAGAFHELIRAGKIRRAAACNLSTSQLAEFHAECPLSAVQGQLNLLQRELEQDIIPWCVQHQVPFFAFRPLMTGLLNRDRSHRFETADPRSRVLLWQDQGWEHLHDQLDRLKEQLRNTTWTLPQIAIAWVLSRPGVSGVLCGATRPEQVAEVAGASELPIDAELLVHLLDQDGSAGRTFRD